MTNAGSASTLSPTHSRVPARGPGATRAGSCMNYHQSSTIPLCAPRCVPCSGHRATTRCRSAVGRLPVVLAASPRAPGPAAAALAPPCRSVHGRYAGRYLGEAGKPWSRSRITRLIRWSATRKTGPEIKLPIAPFMLTVKSDSEERNRPVKRRNVMSEWIERQSLPSFMLPCAYLMRAGVPRGVVSG